MLTSPSKARRVTAAYRLPAWLPRAVKIEAALSDRQPHELVEELLGRVLTTKAIAEAKAAEARKPQSTD